MKEWIKKSDLILPKRKSDSRKGENGKVLIIGGSPDYVGALALAGLSALRSGTDWVTVAAPTKVGWAVNCLSSDLVVKKFLGNYFSNRHLNILLKEEKDYDIVLIGNGIGLKSLNFCKNYIKKSKKRLVIDADALKCVNIDWVNNSILTPNEFEFECILKNSKVKNKNGLQKKLRDNVIILKGEVDEIITGNKIFYNKIGNAGMTKAGTGDVLAGLSLGFYSQNNNALMSAKLASYYNGLIGDLLLKKHKGYFYLASDIVEEIEKIIKKKL
ncbi:NAD(P)H-hydrate dehydratase [Candidatus Pacearchaeota archaeon]|nr:NAD(P)H-hydrate dehydratase [Candidatus Pacearchaeota archaeon]